MTPKQKQKIMAHLKAMTPEQIREFVAELKVIPSEQPEAEYKQLQAEYKHLLAMDQAIIKRDKERQRNLALLRDLFAKIDALDATSYRKDPELYAAFLELREAIAEIRSQRPPYEVRQHQGKTGKTKLGRPSLWRGYAGLLFVHAVNEIRKNKSYSIAKAIRYVRKHVPGWEELLQGASDAALQVRYQEASKYWALYFRSCEEFDAVIVQHEANSRRLKVASDWVSAAYARVYGPKDFP
jgi:hypothetical protein